MPFHKGWFADSFLASLLRSNADFLHLIHFLCSSSALISESSLKTLFTEVINQSILHMLILKHSGLSHQRIFIKKTCYKIKLTISQVNWAFDQVHATSKNLLGNLLIWSYDEWLLWDQGNYLVNFLETYCIVSNKIMTFLLLYQSTSPKGMGGELLWTNLFLYNIFEHHLIGTKLCHTSVFANQKHLYFIYFYIRWLNLICESCKSYKSKFTKLLVLISFKYFIIFTLNWRQVCILESKTLKIQDLSRH